MAGTAFTRPARPDDQNQAALDAWKTLYQFAGVFNGDTDWQRLLTITGVDDDDDFVLTVQNQGAGGHILVPGIFAVSNAGVVIGTLNVTTLTATTATITTANITTDNVTTLTVSGVSTHNGNTVLGNASGDTLTVNATETHNAAATFNAAVTLGDAAGDAITVNGTPTFNTAVSFLNGLTVGDANTDSLVVIGVSNFRNAANTATQLYVDAGNNRVQVGSATAMSSATNSILEVSGNRSYFAPNGESLAIGLRWSAATTGQFYLGVSNSATPDLLLSSTAGTQIARAFNGGGFLVGSATALTGSEKLEASSGLRVQSGGILLANSGNIDGNGGTAGQIRIGAVIVNASSLSGSEELRVNGQSRLEGAVTVTASGIDVTGSSIFQSGLTVASGLAVTTGNVTFPNTNLGFFGSAANSKQTVTGSRGGNAALASLLSALANYGLVTDSSTA